MEAFLIYFLKSSGIILLFLACYRFFLSRETLHAGNRYFLFSGLILAIILPLISYTKIVWVDITSLYVPHAISIVPEVSNEAAPEFQLSSILFAIYTIGILFGIARLLVQLLSLRKVFGNSRAVQEGKFKILESYKPLQPFSFFNCIIYHPESHSEEDIKAIVAHEKIHARQYHSVDIFTMHLFAIFQWCNPFVYLYRFYVKENLEFIADTETISDEIQKENYQYLLVKNSLGEKHFDFVNPFFNSSDRLTTIVRKLLFGESFGQVKKRIVMLNKKKSKKINSIKYGLMLPLLIGFILLFNVETIAKIRTTSPSVISAEQNRQMVDPKVYSISKEASDAEIKRLKKKIEKENGELSIKNLKRNSDGEIIAISLTYKLNEAGYVTGNYDAENDINTIHFGQNEKGGLFISTDEATLSELKKGEMPKLKKQDFDRTDAEGTNKSSFVEPRKQIKNDKFNAVVYDKDKTGDFPVYTVLHNQTPGRPSLQIPTVTPLKSFYTAPSQEKIKNDKFNEVVYDKDKTGDFLDRLDLIYPYSGPLYLVNGVETPQRIFSTINPQDIESTTVLKGRQAISVYGEKGRHGVVNIRTKGFSYPYYLNDPKPFNSVFNFLANSDSTKTSRPTLNYYLKVPELTRVSSEKTEKPQQDIDGALIMVDGRKMSKKKFDKIPADEIKSMHVLKRATAEKKYGEKGKNGVLEVALKKKGVKIRGAGGKPLIIIDGKEASNKEMESLDQNKIKSISVLKDKQAIKKYGKKGKDGVVEIITKEE